ncbi:MAG TPA: hypothetical protein DCQ31_12100 [Bacteroidales bacterium]|nr:hypothetical protein [Bacteroidales bacterium]
MKYLTCTLIVLLLSAVNGFAQTDQINQLVKAIESDYNLDYGYTTTVDFDHAKKVLHVKNQYCEFWFNMLTLSNAQRETTAQLVFNSSVDDIVGTCTPTPHKREFFNFKTGSVVDRICSNVMQIKTLTQGGSGGKTNVTSGPQLQPIAEKRR